METQVSEATPSEQPGLESSDANLSPGIFMSNKQSARAGQEYFFKKQLLLIV